MSPETAFQIVNTAALLAWIYLVVAARWTPQVFRVVRYAFPGALALVYISALVVGEKPEGASFTSLKGVTALFTSPWGVVAGWIHYLAFDFFVGCWILADSIRRGIGHGWIVVPMIFTFMFGPIGLLQYLGLVAWRKRGSKGEVQR